jgi:MFS family permease
LTVALLWVVGFFNYLDRIALVTMHDSIVAAIPMTEAQFGKITAVFLWVYGFCSPFGGFLADRFSRSGMIIASMFTWSATTWLTAQATTYEGLLVARAVMGLAEASYLPAALALISDYHRDRTRSLATGIHMTGLTAGAGLGGWGGWLAEHHSWNFAFSFFGVAGIIYCLVLVAGLRDAPRESNLHPAATGHPVQARLGEAVASLFGQPAYILLLGYWGMFGAASWAVGSWMPTYINERFHVGQGAAGLTTTGYTHIGSLLGVFIGSVWADRWNRTHARARIFVPVIGLSAAALSVAGLVHTDIYPLAIAGLFICGLGRAFTDGNTMPVLCLISDARFRATGFGIMNLFAMVIGGLSIYATGALRDLQARLADIFQLGAAGFLLCALLLFLVKPRPAPGTISRGHPVEEL